LYAQVGLDLEHLRELVREANHVTDDRVARNNPETLQESQFRMLDHPIFCGVLHLADQTKEQAQGDLWTLRPFRKALGYGRTRLTG
jgi:hypothetical protein